MSSIPPHATKNSNEYEESSSSYDRFEVLSPEPTRKDKYFNIFKSVTNFFRFRGLEDDEWDVHTIATAPSLVGTTEMRRAASIVSDNGYKITGGSSWGCLNGKCRGFFDTFNAPVFLTGTILTVGFIILFGCAPDLANQWFPPAKDALSVYCGWIYVIAADFFVGVLLYIAFSSYGDIKLGPDDSEPEFSFTSWANMLFSAGMGTGLIFYGCAEPMYTYASPPTAVLEQSDALNFERAIPVTLFNWGIHAWGLYSSLGLAICYFSARLRLPISLRSALYPLLGSWTLRWPGHIVDLIAIIGTIFGLASSLGLGVVQISAGLNYLNDGIPTTFITQGIIIIVITIIAMISVLSGTDKGVKWLSNINSILAFLLFLMVWFINRPADCPEDLAEGQLCAPVKPYGSFLMKTESVPQNFGYYFQILIERSFRTGAYDEAEKEYMKNWTILYLGWFLSWSPFVGTFLAEISRGRTMRQYIIGTLGLPLIVTVLWFSVMGVFGLNAVGQWTNPDPFDPVAHPDMTIDDWNNILLVPVERMLFVLYDWNYALGLISKSTVGFISVLTLTVLSIYFISSCDSGCLVITIIGSGGNRDPPKWQKIFWCWIVALIAAVLLNSGGDDALNSLQALVIILGLPLAIMLSIMMFGLIKTLRYDPYIVHKPKPTYALDQDVIALIKNEVEQTKRKAIELGTRPTNSLFFRKSSKNPILNTFDDIEVPFSEDDHEPVLSSESK